MNKVIRCLTSVGLALALVGCAEGGMNKQTVGAATGGLAGGLLGATVFHGHGQVAGALGGAVLGALAGGAVGGYMDQQDRMNAERAMQNTRVGQQAQWTNSQGATYTVRPVKQTTEAGQECRLSKTTVSVDGKSDVAYTKICREPGGAWYVKNN